MSHLPIRPVTSRLFAVAGALVAACAITPAACAATTPAATTPAATSPGTSSPAPTSRAAFAQCTGAAALHFRIAGSQAIKAAGITDYTLDFTNTSGSTCSLSGYPYVSMISKSGAQLGSPAGHGLMTIVPLVILAPGASAHTTLAYNSGKVTAGRGCGPVATGYELRVFVGGQKRAMYAGMGVHACSRAGQVYLTVTQAFRAGAGPA
jgi:hypothetical protein